MGVAYAPIEDYGIIGDLHTVALVGKHGSVDWFCFPNLDSPSIFAALLDDARGGRFQIAPLDDQVAHKQMYFPDTNVLFTRFLSDRGVGEICDLMPLASTAEERDRHRLIRRVSVVRGTLQFRMVCPRLSITPARAIGWNCTPRAPCSGPPVSTSPW
jgi:GH15 family glucan-1,4-alpha-glucosidase